MNPLQIDDIFKVYLSIQMSFTADECVRASYAGAACVLTLCCIPGEHVAVDPPRGASGDSGNSHGSGHLHTDGWDWGVQPGCWTDFGHQVQVGSRSSVSLQCTDAPC